jgi:hypothetical protein
VNVRTQFEFDPEGPGEEIMRGEWVRDEEE